MSVAVAHNDTEEGRAALLFAAGEAFARGSKLYVLHVLDEFAAVDEDPSERLRLHVEELLSGTDTGGWELRFAPESDNRAEAILSLAEDAGAELLVIGSRKRSPLGKFVLGSTVQRVVLDAPMPVFVVKAAGAGSDG